MTGMILIVTFFLRNFILKKTANRINATKVIEKVIGDAKQRAQKQRRIG